MTLPKCLLRENVFEILCLLFKSFRKMLIANWILMIDASVFPVKVTINFILKKVLNGPQRRWVETRSVSERLRSPPLSAIPSGSKSTRFRLWSAGFLFGRRKLWRSLAGLGSGSSAQLPGPSGQFRVGVCLRVPGVRFWVDSGTREGRAWTFGSPGAIEVRGKGSRVWQQFPRRACEVGKLAGPVSKKGRRLRSRGF